VRRCSAAIQEAVAFLKTATAEQAIGAIGAGMCGVGLDTCTSAFTRNREAFAHDCRVSPEMAATVKRALSSFDPAIAAATIDLDATHTDRYLS
jgi:NitT/TauT family transport system substrate-binding protein